MANYIHSAVGASGNYIGISVAACDLEGSANGQTHSNSHVMYA